MMKCRGLLIVLAILWSTSVLAAQQRTYNFVMTPDEANYVARLLEERPLKESGNLYGKLQVQITQQDQAANAAAVESFRRQTREQVEKEAADKKVTEENRP